MHLCCFAIWLMAIDPQLLAAKSPSNPFHAELSGVDSNGVQYYSLTSGYLGGEPSIVRVLKPRPAPRNGPCRFLYILPVTDGVTDLSSSHGDGLEQARILQLHERYKVTIVAPSFHIEPWYVDHDSDPTRRLESFIVHHLVPWIDSHASEGREVERWLLGFSKSGYGALNLIFRHSHLFHHAAAWDTPVNVADINRWKMEENFGSRKNFEEYYLPKTITDHRTPFLENLRLWLGGDDSEWHDHMKDLHQQMKAAGIQHVFITGTVRNHHWDGGWLESAVAFLGNPSHPPSSNIVIQSGCFLLTILLIGLVCWGYYQSRPVDSRAFRTVRN
jgi:esterase/lipase superfamily enzyme